MFENWPRLLERDDYACAQNEFLERVSKMEGVRGIARFGSVSFPGLSDLDLIVTVDDDIRKLNSTINHIDSYSAATRYVLYHPQFVVPEALASRLRWLLPIFEMETVHGSVPSLVDPPAEDARELAITFVLQSVLTDFAWVFGTEHPDAPLDVRMLQAKLNLLARNLELLALPELPLGDESAKFCQAVRDLRRDWFALDHTDLERSLLETLHAARLQVCVLVDRLVDCLAAHESRVSTIVSAESECRLAYGSGVTRFARIACEENSLSSLRAAHALPLALAAPLVVTASEGGIVGDWIRSQFSGPRVAPSTMLPSLRERVRLANLHLEFLRRLGLRYGGFNYWGMRADFRPGVRSWLRRARWRLNRLSLL